MAGKVFENAISPSEWIKPPGSTQPANIARPDCGHNQVMHVSYMNNAIDSAQAEKLREELKNTPCEQCAKEKKNARV